MLKAARTDGHIHAHRFFPIGPPGVFTVGEAVFDDDILASAVTETSQALIESFNEIKLPLLGPTREVPHPIDPSCRLLGSRGQRPRRRSANERDELPPLHSITSSARASSVGGMVRP